MPRTKLEIDFSIRNVREVRVGLAKGFGHSRWLVLQVVGQDGSTTDIAAWGEDSAAAELIVEDDVSVRRVLTIHDEEQDDA